MGKHTDELGSLDNFQAPWESATGEDQTLDPTKLKRYLFGLLLDKAKAQDVRDEASEKVTSLETDLQAAKADVAKGDPTGKIADLEKKLAKATTERDKVQGNLDRLEVGIEKGLTPKQAARLQGDTREELEADADELLEVFGPPASNDEDNDDEDEDEDDEEQGLLRRTPRGQTVNPGDPRNGADQEPDYEAIADAATRGRVNI